MKLTIESQTPIIRKNDYQNEKKKKNIMDYFQYSPNNHFM